MTEEEIVETPKRGPGRPPKVNGPVVVIQSRTVSEADSHLPLEAIISNVPGGPYQAFGETEAIALFNASKRWIIVTEQQKAA